MIHILKADRYSVSPQMLEVGTKGSWGNDYIKLSLSPEWDGLTVKISFYPSRSRPVVTVYGGDTAAVPAEVYDYGGCTKAVISGETEERVMISLPFTLKTDETLKPANTPPREPTPDEFAQLYGYMQGTRELAQRLADESAASANGAAASAEEAKKSAEAALTAQNDAETSEKNAKSAAQSAENAKNAAETAKDGAQAAVLNAKDYSEEAKNAKTDAQSAKNSAEAAAANSAAAAIAAASAAQRAADSEAAARNSAAAASSSAANAKTREDNAAASAKDASDSANSAASSATAAENAKNEALTLRDEAIENINSVKDAAASEIENAKNAAVNEAESKFAELSEAEINDIQTAGAEQRQAIENAGSEQVEAVKASAATAAKDAAETASGEAKQAAAAAQTSAENAKSSESAAQDAAQRAESAAESADNSANAASDSAASAARSSQNANDYSTVAVNAANTAVAAANSSAQDAADAKIDADRADDANANAKASANAAALNAKDASDRAIDSKASAQSAAQSAASAAKSEAAASAAKDEAETLRDEAVNNINSVKDSAVTVVENTRDTAVSDVNAARDDAVGAVENTGTTAVRTVQEAQNTAVGEVTAEGDTQTARVQAAGDGAVSEIARAGQGALSGVNDAGAAAVSAVGAARDAAVSDVNAAADARIEEIQQAGGGTGTDVGAVRFDEAQELTDEQQAQARVNIGAVGREVYEYINDALDLAPRYGVSGVGGSNPKLTRLWDADGLTAMVGTDVVNEAYKNDFDNLRPFNRRKCVGTWSAPDESGRAHFTVGAYFGDPDYTEDGSKGDYVAVEVEPFWYYQNLEEGVLGVSAGQHSGWKLHPVCLDEYGNARAKTYLPCYNLAVNEAGNAVSLPGYHTSWNHYQGLRDICRTYGGGNNAAHLEPMAVRHYEWLLFTIEFATTNCQSVMMGAASMPYSANDKVALDGTDTDHVVVTAAIGGKFVVGQAIYIGTTYSTSVSPDALNIITAIEPCDPDGTPNESGTYRRITYSGRTNTVTAGTTTISTRPWITGSCNDVTTPSGSPVSNTDSKHPMRYRYRENIWANCYSICNDLFDQLTGAGTDDDPYHIIWHYLIDPDWSPASYSRPNATDFAGESFVQLDQITEHKDGFIKQIEADPDHPECIVPVVQTGGGSTTYFADYAYFLNGMTDIRSVHFGGSVYSGAYFGVLFFLANYLVSASLWYFGGGLYFRQ